MPTHYCPGQGCLGFTELVWAEQRRAETTAPASTRSTFSAWFELSLTFDPRLNLVCNWWLYIESYEQANRRNPAFSKQPAPHQGRLQAAHVFQPKHPAAFASSFSFYTYKALFFFVRPVSQAQNKTNPATPQAASPRKPDFPSSFAARWLLQCLVKGWAHAAAFFSAGAVCPLHQQFS